MREPAFSKAQTLHRPVPPDFFAKRFEKEKEKHGKHGKMENSCDKLACLSFFSSRQRFLRTWPGSGSLAFRACSCIMLHTSALLPLPLKTSLRTSWAEELTIDLYFGNILYIDMTWAPRFLRPLTSISWFHPSCSSCSIWSSLSCCVRLATCKRTQTGGRC